MTHEHTRELQAEIDRLRKGAEHQDAEVCQILGRVLDYPWYKDDPKNFPNSTEEHGVCVGDHVAESIAMEAASTINSLRADVERLRECLSNAESVMRGLYLSDDLAQGSVYAICREIEAVIAATEPKP